MMNNLFIYIHIQQVLCMHVAMCVFAYVCVHILHMKVCTVFLYGTTHVHYICTKK